MIQSIRKRSYLLAQVVQKLPHRLRLELTPKRELDVELLLKRLNHVKPLPWSLKAQQLGLTILSIGVIRNRLPTSELDDKVGDHLLRHLHEVVHIRIGHVKLARGKLGVVRHVDRLIAEDTANFIYSVQPAHYELLQVELGGNTQVEVEVQVVVMRYEWLRGCASCDHVHHRCFHLSIY